MTCGKRGRDSGPTDGAPSGCGFDPGRAAHPRKRPPAVRRRASRRPPPDERRAPGADHAALLPAPGGARQRALSPPTGDGPAGTARIAEPVPERVRSSVSSAIPRFEDPDLDRLCFWMATGSGKDAAAPPALLPVSPPPPEGARQHPAGGSERGAERPAPRGSGDLRRSGAAGSTLRPRRTSRTRSRAIEITKLAEEKKGQGVTVPVEAFAGNNPGLRGRGAQGIGRRGLAQGAGRPGGNRVHLRVQRHLRTGARRGRESGAGPEVRKVHPVRLFLPVVPPGRIRKGLPGSEPRGQPEATSATTRNPRTPCCWPDCCRSSNSG